MTIERMEFKYKWAWAVEDFDRGVSTIIFTVKIKNEMIRFTAKSHRRHIMYTGGRAEWVHDIFDIKDIENGTAEQIEKVIKRKKIKELISKELSNFFEYYGLQS